jgi:hypothetical protein
MRSSLCLKNVCVPISTSERNYLFLLNVVLMLRKWNSPTFLNCRYLVGHNRVYRTVDVGICEIGAKLVPVNIGSYFLLWRQSSNCATFNEMIYFYRIYNNIAKTLRGFGPLANYADRATAACWRSSANSSWENPSWTAITNEPYKIWMKAGYNYV